MWGIGILLPWNAVLCCFDFFSLMVSKVYTANIFQMKDAGSPAFVFPFATNGFLAITQIALLIKGSGVPE